MNEHLFLSLLQRFHSRQLSAKELREFLNATEEPQFESLIGAELYQELQSLRAEPVADPERASKVWEAVKPSMQPQAVVRRMPWLSYAAAVILLIIGVGAYYYFEPRSEKPLITATTPHPTINIAPGGQRAVLTLSDGSTINLDSAANGHLAEQNGAKVIKKADGQVEYSASQRGANTVAHNTMSTPKGGQYQLKLPDGTQVWLNAASSITYPTAFTEKERTVTITGEAYFEVAKNKAKPFIVHTPTDVVSVLGTSFNLNAYEDEPGMKTTLVEGRVKVNKVILTPGQAYFNGNVTQTNVSQDIAWKKGSFNFYKLKLDEVMRQIGRWYDLTITYQNGVPDITLWGEMGRDLNLSEVLIVLSDMRVKYKLEGKHLIVLNKT